MTRKDGEGTGGNVGERKSGERKETMGIWVKDKQDKESGYGGGGRWGEVRKVEERGNRTEARRMKNRSWADLWIS